MEREGWTLLLLLPKNVCTTKEVYDTQPVLFGSFSSSSPLALMSSAAFSVPSFFLSPFSRLLTTVVCSLAVCVCFLSLFSLSIRSMLALSGWQCQLCGTQITAKCDD